MSEPRRHHIIPQMILRRFTDDRGKLHVFDKRRSPSGVYAASPANVFVQRDLNALQMRDGSRNTGLEKWYSEFEGEVAPVIDKIVTSAIVGKLPALSVDEKNTWDNFVYHQQKRPTDIFERLGLVQDFDRDLPGFIEEFEREERPLTEKERTDLHAPDARLRMIQYASVVARGRGSHEAIDLLAGRGLAIGVVQLANKSFVIGDHPLARMGPEPHLGHPQLELWFPIAPQVAVSPWGLSRTESLVVFQADHVRRVNEVIFRQGNIIAGRSPALVQSLATIR